MGHRTDVTDVHYVSTDDTLPPVAIIDRSPITTRHRVVFGIIAVVGQRATKAIDVTNYSFYDRILFASYGLVTYLWKSVLPFLAPGSLRLTTRTWGLAVPPTASIV